MVREQPVKMGKQKVGNVLLFV
uniref:Uncharacterized protein n=1 Tax=Anguilla anguilla TaxID=7936 RepID=A0A0E9XI55_ANGAN